MTSAAAPVVELTELSPKAPSAPKAKAKAKAKPKASAKSKGTGASLRETAARMLRDLADRNDEQL